MNVGSLFSGIGLLDYGLHLAGFEHAWLCESDPFRRSVLERRFPGVPVYEDVRGVGDGAARVDLVAGGFPCKGASSAGKREGFGHPETVLWREMLRAVRELRPRYVLVENVAALTSMAPPGGRPGDLFGEVLAGLAASGYDAEWDCLPASAFGAPHRRDRVFVTASADAVCPGLEGSGLPGPTSDCASALADADEGGRAEQPQHDGERGEGLDGAPRRHAERRGLSVEWGEYEPAVRRWEAILGRPAPAPLTGLRGLDDGDTDLLRVRRRVDRSRLSALGDGVLVQAGWLCGRRIVDYERGRVA